MTIGIKVEQGFAALIGALNVETLSVYTGLSNEEKDAPAAIVSAFDASEDFPNSGLYHVKLRVMVKTVAADTDIANADSITGAVFQACIEVTKENLSTLAGLAVFDLFIEGQESDQAGDAWTQTLTMEVIAGLNS